MTNRETLKYVIDRMNDFTNRIEAPMDIVFETTHYVNTGKEDPSRLFSTCTATISVRGRKIIEKATTLETRDSNEEQLCKEILSEMIMFSIDGIYNILMSQDELKKSPIITNLHG